MIGLPFQPRVPANDAEIQEEIESFPTQLFETADVSLVEGTIAGCNYSFFFTSPRNRTQEADGSIPFSSTRPLRFFFWKVGLKRFGVQTFQT
jgi:hypothetical protein